MAKQLTLANIQKEFEKLSTRINRLAASTANPAAGVEVYTALLSQEGTNDPVAAVVDNTFTTTTFQWARAGQGQYRITASNPVFEEGKVFYFCNTNNQGVGFEVEMVRSTDSIINLGVYDDGSYEDDTLQFLPVEIRVYS